MARERGTTPTRRAAFACLFATTVLSSPAAALDAKPRVPLGRDPGGFAVALIGPGVDYTRTAIADHLARDGEGEIVGWDFIDDDRRPFAKATSNIAEALTRAAPPVRLCIVKADTAARDSLAKALAWIARSPARIVLISTERASDATAQAVTRIPTALLTMAAARFPNLLFVVADAAIRAEPGAPRFVEPTNVVVASVPADGVAPYDGAALAGFAALAAQIAATEPSLAADALKLRVLARATPLPPPASKP